MKKRAKWFQDTTKISISNDISPSSFTIFKNFCNPPNKSIKQTDISINTTKDSLKNSLLSELHQFKQEQLYEEALSCIQTLFEMNVVDENIIYELADIYLLTNDHERAYKWIQQLKLKSPQDNRIYLLETQFFLALNKKEEALSTINQLLDNPPPLFSEIYYLTLDNIIDKLKKIFKTDKLVRRCPALNNYWKKRRQSLKSQKTFIQTNTNKTNNTNTLKGDIMSKINTPLQMALSHIWDLQYANEKDKSIILATPATELSEAIMNQVLSYSKKLWLFNYIADIFRLEKNFSATIYLLRQALLLDDENDLILKNLGYILYQQQDYYNALNSFKDVKTKDFIINDFINKCHKQID